MMNTSHPIKNDLPEVLNKFSFEKFVPVARFETPVP
jgi:hypothetical protein